MLFNSQIFLFVFLPITYLGFWQLRGKQLRYAWLTAASYVFYGYWDYRFCGLMACSTLVSYSAGRAMRHFDADPRRRRLCLVAPIAIDLLLLGFFKYAGFALDTAHSLSGLLGQPLSLPVLQIVLPVGISFYTFHTISYMVDS